MNNELYHYGVPGMKWGKRKSVTTKQTKPKLSKGKKVAIGAAVAGTALVAIGAKPIARLAGNITAGAAITKSLWNSL